MNRCILLAGVVGCSLGAASLADEYRLRLDTIGYVDEPAADEKPKETTLLSIEVIARPEAAFHGKTAIGTETLSLSGELRRTDSGGFVVEMKYAHAAHRGNSVVAADGSRKPVPNTSEFQTTIAVTEGESVALGGFESQRSKFGKPQLKSKIHYVLVLTKYQQMDE